MCCRAEKNVYAAQIDDALLMKIGAGDFTPEDSSWQKLDGGRDWTIWSRA